MTSNISPSEKVKSLTQALAEHYESDSLAPSLILAYLPTEEWYASIARMPNGMKSRAVITSATADTLEEALEELESKWRTLAG